MIKTTLLIVLISLSLVSKAQKKPLYAFDFNMDSIPVPERTKMLVGLGYSGVTFALKNDKQLEKYNQYLSTQEAKDGKFSIPVVYFPYHFHADPIKEEELWKRALSVPSLKVMWVILVDRNQHTTFEEGMKVLSKMVDEAAKLGKDIVIYPHDNTLIESVEEALPFIEKLNKPNIYVTMHSCHELRAGNGDRMDEVAIEATPYLKFASIAGSDKTMYSPQGTGDWEDAIKPLDKGDYDMSRFLKALNEVGYKGEIFLHTFGLKDAPKEHLSRSMEAWRKLNDE